MPPPGTTVWYVLVQMTGRLPPEEFGPFESWASAETFLSLVVQRGEILNATIEERKVT